MPQSFAEELSAIPMSTHLGQSLERAHRFAREQSHRAVTLEHLLLALTEDAEAAVILQSANIELGRLSTEVSGYLGRLPEDMRGDGSTEPRPDGELLRVLQAAASAAKQSRRRQIDGAIVLAAVVGDGKTPAAGLLKALGMTFEEAIRALQRANTKARLKPASRPATPAPAGREATPTPAAAPARADPKPAQPAEPAAPAAETAAATEPAEAVQSLSSEDILAAARARIQRRSAAGAARLEPAVAAPVKPVSAPAEVDAEPHHAGEPADTAALTEAIEAAMAGTVVRGTEPAPAPAADPPARTATAPAAHSAPPPPPPVGQAAQPTWTPPPAPRPVAAEEIGRAHV